MMKEVLTQMEKLKISPSYDTFAAQLLGIAGQKNPSEEDIKEVMQQLKEQVIHISKKSSRRLNSLDYVWKFKLFYFWNSRTFIIHHFVYFQIIFYFRVN